MAQSLPTLSKSKEGHMGNSSHEGCGDMGFASSCVGIAACPSSHFSHKGMLKGLWHASANVRHLDFCSGKRFFKIGFWWRNPLPTTLRRPRKPQYQYSRAIWSILEVSNAIFFTFVQGLLRKFEVVEEKCTKPCLLLSVFLQTDQVWRVMWSSGFPWYSRGLKIGRSREWSWSTTWLPIVCNYLLSQVTGIWRRKPSNLLLYRKSCEVWGKNPSNMKRFNRHSIYDSDS